MSTEKSETGLSPVTENPWSELRRFTRARVALGRAGTSLPTKALLAFQLDHARAVDAVHRPLDINALRRALGASPEVAALAGKESIEVHSEAADRVTFLQRPDLGRRLREADYQQLHTLAARLDGNVDLAILVSGGLSAAAVQQHALPFLEAFASLARERDLELAVAPVVVASQARVALGDDVGEALGARLVLVLIGERPGLTSPDSMGAYLTWSPRRGTLDSQRNCISNIRPEGLAYEASAAKALYLVSEAQRLARTGVDLKDRAGEASLDTGADERARPRFQLTDGTGRAGKAP
jgi:ethanolamine ammonia-lyase small subunit